MTTTINASTSAGLVQTADTSGVLALQTAGTTALSISASQVVTLTNALPVASGGSGVTTSTGTGANVLGTSPTITTPTISSLSSASATALTLQSAGTTAITVDTSQNVGIGVTPSATGSGKALEIGTVGNTLWGIGAADLQISAGTYYNGGNKYAVTGSAVSAYELVSGSHRWYYAASGTAGNTASFSESMRIDSSGRLLVNKTSTSSTNGAKVYVAGHFSQPTGTANTDGTTDAKNYGYGWCASASEDAMAGLLTSNLQGSWGMDLYLWLRGSGGGSLLNRFQVSNAGSCYNTTGTYGTISDINVKENVIPASNYLNKLLQVEVVKYSLKEEHSDVPTKLGVVAQQVEQIFPNIVEQTNSSNEDGDLVPTKAVKYSVFVPMLIKAIQELKAINDTQAETINAQSAALAALTARITALEGN